MLLIAPLFLLGARCVEHDSVRKGADGDWHIYGEIYNDTDVQGTDILLSGTLIDESDRVIGIGQTQTCPGDLSPGTFSVYDIRIQDSAGLAQPAGHKINVLNGSASANRLPALPFTDEAFESEAYRRADGSTTWNIVFHYRPPATGPAATGDVYGCVAFYDEGGDVILVERPDGTSFDQLSTVGRSQLTRERDATVPADAVGIRALFWLGRDGMPDASDYASVASDLVPIVADQ